MSKIYISAKTKARPHTVYMVVCETLRHIYIGMTSNFYERSYNHRIKKGSWFTKKHGVKTILKIYKDLTYDEAVKKENELTCRLRKLQFVVTGGDYAHS